MRYGGKVNHWLSHMQTYEEAIRGNDNEAFESLEASFSFDFEYLHQIFDC